MKYKKKINYFNQKYILEKLLCINKTLYKFYMKLINYEK